MAETIGSFVDEQITAAIHSGGKAIKASGILRAVDEYGILIETKPETEEAGQTFIPWSGLLWVAGRQNEPEPGVRRLGDS